MSTQLVNKNVSFKRETVENCKQHIDIAACVVIRVLATDIFNIADVLKPIKHTMYCMSVIFNKTNKNSRMKLFRFVKETVKN